MYVFAGAHVPKYTGLCSLLGLDHVARQELERHCHPYENKHRAVEVKFVTVHVHVQQQPSACQIYEYLKAWYVYCMYMLKTIASHWLIAARLLAFSFSDPASEVKRTISLPQV